MFAEISRILDFSAEETKKHYKFFTNRLIIEQEIIFAMKQKLYNFYSDEEDRKNLTELKKNPARYERAVMILAIQNYRNLKKTEKMKSAIKNEKMKNRVKKPSLLENKLRSIFPEIQLYRQQKSTFVEITKLLKKYHRSMFNDYKLSPSYIRRVILKLESEQHEKTYKE